MTAENRFTCQDCGRRFTVPKPALEKYPNWTPRQCMDCRSGKRQLESAADALLEADPSAPSPATAPVNSRGAARPSGPLAAVLSRHSGGPQSGIFTDGFCEPNPGRGGWGAVKVRGGEIVDERRVGENPSTNNRMELRALIEAYSMLDGDEAIEVYSDSLYCVKTVNEWAAAWEAKGWKRKTGAIMNLELVQELYGLAKAHPRAKVQWIRGHAGSRWNEYADALARLGADAAS
jgi:ribonuclease HI